MTDESRDTTDEMEQATIETPPIPDSEHKPWWAILWTRRAAALALGLSVCYLSLSMISHFFTGPSDHSLVDELRFNGWIGDLPPAANWMGRMGAWISHYLIFEWIGLGSFLLPTAMAWVSLHLYDRVSFDPRPLLLPALFGCMYLSTVLGFLELSGVESMMHLSGGIGYEMASLLERSIGVFTPLALALIPLGIVLYLLRGSTTWPKIARYKEGVGAPSQDEPEAQPSEAEELNETEAEEAKEATFPTFELEFSTNKTEETEAPEDIDASPHEEETSDGVTFEVETQKDTEVKEPIPSAEEPTPQDSYRLPPLDLLALPKGQKIDVDAQELEQNKEKIVETLTNFSIDVSTIKASVGPTVTLYEIIPAPGVRISKIKSLEDDIALSLSALGIRIIAPMPGKGTIGIEVPNKNRETTPLRAALSHPRFQSSDHEMPIVLGKRISGEVEVVDLCSMPHILMAGATGQGKSVGLNVMLSSLLYKKRPNDLKLVLIDPKKVELSLFSCIEHHFLAKIPNGEEAIITDTQEVIHTLSALCQEMDNRYELLKEARCRNIKEYNTSATKRDQPTLPYIVLVIDELADLMMTAGKEVEMPIARLAQLARAIGIHLIVATQRPSVNVITGIIKANFPARISYRVTAQIDSRTILDTRGAEQLVGMGDMLFSTGNEQIRLQCPYIDTKEVEAVCQFISDQEASAPPYLLPEVETESSARELDIKERDVLFEDAAALIVQHQQGSASLIQRKMEIGFNRAGRLIDQMEAAGIVGPPQGSKPREVLISDTATLFSTT